MKKLLLVLVTLIISSVSYAREASLSIKRSPGQINVELLGIVCDFCARALEKVFEKQSEVEKISVDLDSSMIFVYLKKGQSISDEKLNKLIEDAGYQIKQDL